MNAQLNCGKLSIETLIYAMASDNLLEGILMYALGGIKYTGNIEESVN